MLSSLMLCHLVNLAHAIWHLGRSWAEAATYGSKRSDNLRVRLRFIFDSESVSGFVFETIFNFESNFDSEIPGAQTRKGLITGESKAVLKWGVSTNH